MSSVAYCHSIKAHNVVIDDPDVLNENIYRYLEIKDWVLPPPVLPSLPMSGLQKQESVIPRVVRITDKRALMWCSEAGRLGASFLITNEMSYQICEILADRMLDGVIVLMVIWGHDAVTYFKITPNRVDEFSDSQIADRL